MENNLHSIKNKIQETMLSLVDEIIEAVDKSIEALNRRISDLDFKMEVFELTEPENIAKQIELMTDKTIEYVYERNRYNQAKVDLENQLKSAFKKYGRDSDVAKRITEELKQVETQLQEVTLKILKTEDAIKKARSSIADSIVDKIKNQYKDISSSAVDSANVQIESAKKYHDAQMKMYDEQIKKITDIYDEKIKSLDDEDSEDTYQKELEEKTGNLADLQKRETLYSRDNSLEGRKRLSDIKEERKKAEEELNDFIKKRQKDLLKEQLQKEKDAQIDAINIKKDSEKEMSDAKIEGLEKERDAISSHYESISEDESRWAKIRGALISGNFADIKTELEAMGITLTQLSDGTFDVLSENFKGYSQEVRNFVAEINSMIGNINTVPNIPSQGGSIGNGKDSDGLVLANNINLPYIIDKAKKGIKMDVPTPDKDRIYNMIANSSIPGYQMQEIYNKAKRGQTLDLPTAEKTMFYDLFLEILGKKLPQFRDGGYTGDWAGNGGRQVIVHKKEQILKEGDTKDIFNAVKLLDNVRNMMPMFNMSGLKGILDNIVSSGGVSNSTTRGDLILQIENLYGSKDEAEMVAGTIMKELRKSGY